MDAVLVTELSRWGRSTQDLLDTLYKLAGWNVSVVAMSGMTFELNTPHGRMMATLLAGIAQFERDLISERVKSGHWRRRGPAGRNSGAGRGNARCRTATCSRLQSSSVLLANIGDFCSNYLRMTGTECSRSLRTYSHCVRRACNHRLVLTLIANGIPQGNCSPGIGSSIKNP